MVGSAIVRQIERDSSQLESFLRDLTRPLARIATGDADKRCARDIVIGDAFA